MRFIDYLSKSFSVFLLAERGAKEQLRKRKRRKKSFVSAEATADLGGSAELSRKFDQSF